MLILDLFKMALRSLIANTLRTFLTALGMIIGVASVISMISIGEGARQQTLSTIAKFGTNIITIKPGRKKTRHVSADNVKTLVLSDTEAIEAHIPLITGVAAQVYRSAQLKYGNKNIRVNAISAGPLPTLAARSIPGFSEMTRAHREKSPLKRNINHNEVANTALFLISDLSSGITGSIIPVDAGYGIIAL